jgi:hypothetical protein
MICVFRAEQTAMSDVACREAWLAAGQPGESHVDGILFPTWDEAIDFAHKWAEAYRRVSLSRPGYLDWGYYPHDVHHRYEVQDLAAGPITQEDQMSRFGGIRQVRIAWAMEGLCRRQHDGWGKPDPWLPIRPYSTGIHVIAHAYKSYAWSPRHPPVEGGEGDGHG